MYDVITCKYEKDTIKTAKKMDVFIFSIIYLWGWFSDAQGAANSIVGGQIWPKFKLIQDFMHVLITCKIEKDFINNN